jgi:hypothetical protein
MIHECGNGHFSDVLLWGKALTTSLYVQQPSFAVTELHWQKRYFTCYGVWSAVMRFFMMPSRSSISGRVIAATWLHALENYVSQTPQ